jgi:hypothetical protein
VSTAAKLQEVRIKEIKVTADTITAQLVDGRVISVPLAWSWLLSEATVKHALITESLEKAMVCIGRTLMKISVQRVCFTQIKNFLTEDNIGGPTKFFIARF